MPFADGVKDAPVIVHGTVGNSYTDWGHERDGGKRIFTYWELSTDEVLKGQAEAGGIIRMREMGGEKDGVGMQVAGAATFSQGEEVVVFLGDKNDEGSYDVWGMSMGKYTFTPDPDGGEPMLRGAGIGLRRPRMTDGDGARPSDVPQKWTVAALRRLIAEQSGAPAPRPAKTALRASPLPRPVPTAAPEPAAASPAPQLQPQAPEVAATPWGLITALGATIVGLLAFVFGRSRKNR
jgi:hypothetical protein